MMPTTPALTLLPRPRQLEFLPGTYRPAPEGLLWLAGALSPDHLRTGRAIQQALAQLGSAPELTAAAGADPGRLAVVVHVGPALVAQPEGYRLTILPGQIRLEAHDEAGAFYGAMTLRQLARQAAATGQDALPCLRINDWPDFAHRGVMLDISRDKVPTLATLKDMIEMLAEWKINQFQLYTEHTFAYRQHREVWEKASPLSGQEILELDAFCRERFIELVPNQNSFGHMDRWLKHERYLPLAESDSPVQTVFGLMMRYTLCPLAPGSLELIEGLYDELLPHFSSRQFNVGCDETVDLGLGKSQAACQERGTERVYLDFLLKVYELTQKHGRTMQFWGDIIIKRPELIHELPANVIALEWGYEANHPFAEDCAKFGAAGVPFYVCPGTSGWNSLIGRTDNALGNLRSAAEHGLAQGALGYLITDWGDNGHWQSLPIAWLGFAYGAALSWAGAANRDLELAPALDLHAFADRAGVMGRLLYDLGNAYKVSGAAEIFNNTLLHSMLLPKPGLRERMRDLTAEGLARTDAYLEEAIGRLAMARMERPDAGAIVAELRNGAGLARHACHLGQAILAAGVNEAAELPQAARETLARELEGLLTEYRACWLTRNRPGGLSDSTDRLETLLKAYKMSA